MKTIYLIGTTSAARTSSETMASAFEQAGGYRRCTQEDYLQRTREIRALDLPPEQATRSHRTASSTASGTPAGTPATPLADRQQHRQQKDAA